MTEALEKSQKYGLIAGLVIVGVVGFFAGSIYGSNGMPQKTLGKTQISESKIKEKLQPVLDAQMQRQRQQLLTIAAQSQNISKENLSIGAEIINVSSSEFGSLYKVTVSVSGTVPSQTGGLKEIDQEQALYITQDGKYLFPEPTNLDSIGQKSQQTLPQ